MEWNLADAKNRFSEVVNLALTEGPQRVRRRKDTVVLMSVEEFERCDRRNGPLQPSTLPVLCSVSRAFSRLPNPPPSGGRWFSVN